MYPQHPLRFGTLSSLRGTGLRVGVRPPSGSVEVAIEYVSHYTGV